MTFLEHSHAIAARRWKSVAPGLELRSFAAATALVSIHIVDAEIVQPHPGTAGRDDVATVVPLGVAFGALFVVAGVIALGGGRRTDLRARRAPVELTLAR